MQATFLDVKMSFPSGCFGTNSPNSCFPPPPHGGGTFESTMAARSPSQLFNRVGNTFLLYFHLLLHPYHAHRHHTDKDSVSPTRNACENPHPTAREGQKETGLLLQHEHCILSPDARTFPTIYPRSSWTHTLCIPDFTPQVYHAFAPAPVPPGFVLAPHHL